MEGAKEIISKSTLINARKERDPSLYYALSNAFPGADSPIRLCNVYWGYYKSLLRSRGYDDATGIFSSEPFGAHTSRRLILHALERIARSYFLFTLIAQEKIYESSMVALKNVNWLVAFSMDTKREFTLRGREEGPVSSMDNMVGPSNYQSSCYCDVVIVSMFLTTNAYDPIFDTQVSPFDSNPWEEVDGYLFQFTTFEEDDPLSWLKNVLPNLRTNPCLKNRTEGEAKNVIATFKLLLSDFIRGKLRTIHTEDKTDNDWAIEQRDIITQIRKFIRDECGGKDLGKPEDASEFFRSILEITGWERIASPIQVQLLTTEYSISSRVLSIQNTNSRIEAPEIPQFIISTIGNHTRTLQSVIDANLGRLDIAEVEDIIIENALNEVHQLLREESDLRKMELPSIPYAVRARRLYTWRSFARIPQSIVFTVTPEGTMIGREATSITLEQEDPIIYLPILGIPDNNRETNPRMSFRVFSVVVFVPGHYYTYFRYPPGDPSAKWYLYNDTSPKIRPIIDPGDETIRKNHIEKQGYMYFCQRIQQQ